MPLSKDSEALTSYVLSVGGHLSSALDFLSPSGAGGRGVVAVTPVRKGSNLAAVPVRACLFVPKKGEHALTPAAGYLRDYTSKEEKEKRQRARRRNRKRRAAATLALCRCGRAVDRRGRRRTSEPALAVPRLFTLWRSFGR